MLQTEEREAVRAGEASQDAPRVLVVQSDPDLRDALAPACRKEGLEVHDCATIALAQEACRQRNIDLIVVDWVVEGLFADELLKFLETALHPRSLPPTLVLSRMGETDTRDCLRPSAPIHGVLTRPTSSDEFAAWAPKFVAVLRRCQRAHERTMHV